MNSQPWDEFVLKLGGGANDPWAREDAATKVADQFTQRLLRLVESRIGPGLGRRVDAEDVVQSVFRSFFRRTDEFQLRRAGDLWRLLATMAVNKVRKQAARHGAEKRDFRKEEHQAVERQLVSLEPTPDDAIALEESLETILQNLTPEQQRIFQMRLDGDSVNKISIELQKSQRTIRRTLQTIRGQLAKTLLEDDG